ncbi:MAG: hypothetical protein NZM12_08415 [Steroidobacteraceae bacterium]|nr:hypothetical protein [Steroidobacteraceae bacterium]
MRLVDASDQAAPVPVAPGYSLAARVHEAVLREEERMGEIRAAIKEELDSLQRNGIDVASFKTARKIAKKSPAEAEAFVRNLMERLVELRVLFAVPDLAFVQTSLSPAAQDKDIL